MSQDQTESTAGSQTLSRGLTALALIGETRQPLTVNALADQLGTNRSAAYRLVRTLEEHRFVQRTANGELRLGLRLTVFAQNVARDLQTMALPPLQQVADALGMTSFLVAFDGAEVITLLTVEPQHAATFVAHRPGRRQPVGQGAPGRVIRSQLTPDDHPPARYETTHDEVVAGVTAIAVPLKVDRPASIAVLYPTRPADIETIVMKLESAAQTIYAESAQRASPYVVD